eukprot:TRINITY_DN11959_c0_g1_i1.p1 TRINITY_DN11959_c0_g1~~TRINITY_DN11959_c0_g1_i1.p1  ORF type:complete len:345 (+),score=96.00 TRINITY_DN11959_c0_g1_i1:54-1088(+)
MAAAGPETTPEAIRGRLVHALVSAQQAVSADTEGDTDTALPLYSEASAVLEQILPFVPEGHAKVMAHNSSIYADRAAELRKEMIELAAGAGSAGVVPAFPVQFVERPPPPLPTESVPGTIRRPFWLMRQVSLSMQTGAYLTSAIFVPKAVWYQPGAHTIVKAVGAKIRYCENLCGLIERLLEAGTSSVPVLVRALDAFTEDAEGLLRSLHKDIPKAEQKDREAAVPSQHGRAKLLAALRNPREWSSALRPQAREPDATYNSYIPWLVNVFETAQRIDLWIQVFARPEHGSDAVIQRLHKISTHFYFGLCAFVVRDMFLLLQRYIKRSQESYSRLFPHGFQVGKT